MAPRRFYFFVCTTIDIPNDRVTRTRHDTNGHNLTLSYLLFNREGGAER